MIGDTGGGFGNALLSFTQNIGVPDKIVTNNHQNVSGSGINWDQVCCDKDIRHILMDPCIYWYNAAEGSWREILWLYEKKRVQKGVPKRLFPYLIN